MSASSEEFRAAVLDMLRKHASWKHAMWYFNIKKFRYINDSYGHSFGDVILSDFYEFLGDRIAQHGVHAHLGDDHFAAFVSRESNDSDAATAAFDSLYRDFNRRLSSLGIEHPVDIAAGVYFLTPDDAANPDLDYLVDQANAAHRRARDQGGSRVVFFDYEYAEKMRRANTLERDLASSIAAGEIEIWMQPLIDFVKGQVVAAEVLARWNHADLGYVSPVEFIPVLEQAGKIGQLDRYIWEEACYAAHNRHKETGQDFIPFSVNVSRAEILDPTLPGFLEGLREKYGIPNDILRLEVTENAYADEPEELIRAVSHLRSRGFLVEMDDFGTGYSSLNMLRNLPIDVLKLDMGFLRNQNSDENDSVILNSVIRMAHGLDIPVIAEGVETIEQAEMLKSMGCRLMQGFFFAKPMPLEQFHRLIFDTRSSTHSYSSTVRSNKISQLLDPRSDTVFFFNNCVGPAFIFSTGADRYDVMLTNDELYTELQIDQHDEDLFRSDLLTLLDVEGRERFRRAVDRACERGSGYCVVRRMDSPMWLDCTLRVIGSYEGGSMLACYVRDATEDQTLERSDPGDHDRDVALRDELTGLLTYHSLDTLIGGDLGNGGGTLLLADVDDFDIYVESHDRSQIDALVDHVADILRTELPKDALLARCGEGLFAAFFPNVYDKLEARANACKIVDALRTRFVAEDEKVTCSIGLAHADSSSGLRLGILYRRALRALTVAKINGGDGFLHYDTARAEVDSGIEVFGLSLRHAVDGELLPVSALEGKDLFNVISRDFETHHSWGLSHGSKRSVRDAVFGALRYRSMAEVPGVMSFDYDALNDTIFLESVASDGTVDQRCIEGFSGRLFDLGENMAPESMARLSTLLADLEYLPSAGNVDLKCRFDEDGEFRWYRFSFTSLRDDKSFVIRGLGYGEDIDLSRESGPWWKDRAMHDGLTGLLNREGLEDAIEVQQAKSPGGMMFMVDVDDFKAINDSLGHLSGDSVLCELADTLLAAFREHDLVGRYGADEMIAFISGITERGLAHARAEMLLDMIGNISVGSFGGITASVGVAMISEKASFYDFLELADNAMHVAKANGKNSYTIADESAQRIEVHDLRASAHGDRTERGRSQMEREARYNRERAEGK